MADGASPADVAASVERRVAGYPLEHILGWAEFCGLRIELDAGVFVPRLRTQLLVNEAAPQIPPIELFWRVHFMLGAAAFSMSGIKALRAIAETDFGVNTSIEQVMRLMVPFLAAGMRAETGVTDTAMATAQLRPRSKSAPVAAKV